MTKEQLTLTLDDRLRPVFERIMGELGIEDNKTAYLMLAAYGYSNGAAATDFNKAYTATRTAYLNDEERALVAAMAMEPGSDEPPSMAIAFQLAERYANGGTQLISELLDSPKGFARAFRETVEQQRDRGEAQAAASASAVG
jgi:hypothetical protein